MQTRDYVEWFIIFSLGVMAIFTISMLNYYGGRKSVQIEAVENSVARWVAAIDKDGQATVKFEWILPTEKKEK
jgi:hypothetical protein